MKTKRQAISDVKLTIKNEMLCDDNTFYKVQFSNDEEDFILVDFYGISNYKDEMLQELKERQKEVTSVIYCDAYSAESVYQK